MRAKTSIETMRSSPAVFRVGLGLALAAALVVQTGLAGAQDEKEEKIRETYRALAVSSVTMNRTRITISIDRWTTDKEHNQLITTLVEKGSEGLRDALMKQEDAGFVHFLSTETVEELTPGITNSAPSGSASSVRLGYAREIRVEGKRIIRLATGRPIWSFSEFVPEGIPEFRDTRDVERSITEMVSTPGSITGLGDPERNHPFSLIVLRLDENNEGEGTFCVAVQMKYDKKKATLGLENLAQDRVHLTRVAKTN